VNLGEHALAAKEFVAAASYFRTALQWNSNGVAAHLGLGNTYLQTSHPQKAREEFAAVLKVSPHSAEAERGIHEARSDGEEQEAFQELEVLVPKQPRNADIHTTYAEELLERDRTSEAKVEALLALKLDNKQWHAYGVLGLIAKKEGDLASARANLETAIKHDSADDDSLAGLGDLDLQEKNYSGAVKLYRQLVKVAPEESEGHRKLAQGLELLGQKDAARVEAAIADAIETAAKSKGGKS
jgi:tetratricopeptide (TPR) repeat protein